MDQPAIPSRVTCTCTFPSAVYTHKKDELKSLAADRNVTLTGDTDHMPFPYGRLNMTGAPHDVTSIEEWIHNEVVGNDANLRGLKYGVYLSVASGLFNILSEEDRQAIFSQTGTDLDQDKHGIYVAGSYTQIRCAVFQLMSSNVLFSFTLPAYMSMYEINNNEWQQLAQLPPRQQADFIIQLQNMIAGVNPQQVPPVAQSPQAAAQQQSQVSNCVANASGPNSNQGNNSTSCRVYDNASSNATENSTAAILRTAAPLSLSNDNQCERNQCKYFDYYTKTTSKTARG